MTHHHDTDRVTTEERPLWSIGDYGRIGDLLADLGRDLVRFSGLGPGDLVLDVGAGTGNASLPAAETGADVVATDPTQELLEVGALEAGRRGLDLRWECASAEDLPFADGTFDVVVSCIGAMFAPDQRATADELVRVCRGGGTVAMANWTPEGAAGRFFRTLAPYAPPAPPGPAPTDWGVPEHVEALFGDRVTGLESRREHVRLRFEGGPAEMVAYYRRYFPPVVATYAGIADDPDRLEALDRDLLAFATAEHDASGGFEYEYLLVLAKVA